MAISGIYKITNKENGKIYIGQSVNIFDRWRWHRTHLQSPQTLYKAFRKYGIENFTFEILEELEPNKEILNEREIYYIEKFNSYDIGYNETRGGNSAHNAFQNISEEDIIRIRQKKMEYLSPREVYEPYSDFIGYDAFHKIWTGEHYPQIMPEIYADKAKLKEIESVLKRGENSGHAVLTEKDVVDIRTRKKNGEKRAGVYSLYKDIITIHGFDGVWYNKKWKHIQV